MDAFIVRPFGTKDGIDFDRVERELVVPALERVGLTGATTGVIARAGNIRSDVFERLLLADLVIADISIHNANVYYELGIRHALRDRKTILIRARQDEVPFDLKTDRYVVYAGDSPADAVDSLVATLQQTIAGEAPDSPVYLLLPALRPMDPHDFRPVPTAFLQEVRLATKRGDRPLLGLLSEELDHLDWAAPGRRTVGRAQLEIQAYRAARTTWEALLDDRPGDVEALLRLGTLYQRLGDFTASTEAITRALTSSRPARFERAEARALIGSSLKAQWTASWRDLSGAAREEAAISSPLLRDALDAYRDGFLEDQNHYYSGINALTLATLLLDLTSRSPDVWERGFASDDDARAALKKLKDEQGVLVAAVRSSIDAARHRRTEDDDHDLWLDLTDAQYAFLTSTRTGYVAVLFRQAMSRVMAMSSSASQLRGRFPTDSAARQMRMFVSLGVRAENARAALEAIGASAEEPAIPAPLRVIVFAGHRIDAPGRSPARFPEEKADAARARIRQLVEAEVKEAPGAVSGIAGGANGGDILFHEVCEELGVPDTLLLAIPTAEYKARSVKDGGAGWMSRFERLSRRIPPVVLSTSDELPGWLEPLERRGYSLWGRNNLWMLHHAFAYDDADITLIVLWDGKGGDGPGGTADMVALAERRGVKVLRIDPLTL